MPDAVKVRTCLWYDSEGLEAAEFYCALLPESRIENISRQPESDGAASDKSVLVVNFTLAGSPFMALNGGPHYSHTPAASISVLTEDQRETDRLWSDLTTDGGSESMCGWLMDRFGISWQITPRRLLELMGGPKAPQVFAAMMKMNKIDIAALEAAAQT